MDPGDPRSQHVNHFLDVVEELRPRAFVMENVKALGASPRCEHVRSRLLDRAQALGYERSLFVLNAQDYAVPQSRERMFLVGLRGTAPKRPVPTTAVRVCARDDLAALPLWPAATPICDAYLAYDGTPVVA